MITYEMVKRAMSYAPPKKLVDLYNEVMNNLLNHPMCVEGNKPFQRLDDTSFCVSGTSIQSNYIAFILGKKNEAIFPEDVINLFFNVSLDYKIQFKMILGNEINGCICVIHQEKTDFDLQEIFNKIYE